ncbi:hypothetical protein [Pseudonocardia sp. NPDC049635]|uniref:hypothetical protein n=1 Tax=Pseudonocardia sp. NPDC049635 TaxID=3155506 RepID=UPI003407C667
MTTGWDIVNAIAQTIGALGTAGALIVAVQVYRRQVNDQRRDQAAQVVVTYTEGVVLLRNHSDRLIRPLIVAGADEGSQRGFTLVPSVLGPGELREIPIPAGSLGDDEGKPSNHAVVTFVDVRGRVWMTDSRGTLMEGGLPPVLECLAPDVRRARLRRQRLWARRFR